MSVKYEKICAIIQTSCTRSEHVGNDVRNDDNNAHVAIQSFKFFTSSEHLAMTFVRMLVSCERE